MDCNEYQNFITDYLEGTASPSEHSQMESHLLECETCRALVKEEKSVMKQLYELPMAPCPDEIIDQVIKAIEEPHIYLSERIYSWLGLNCSWKYGLAGTITIALLAVLIYLPGQNRQSTEVFEYTTKEIQQAKVETKLALAYFAVYSRKTETVFKKIDILEPVIKPIKGDLKKALGKIPFI